MDFEIKWQLGRKVFQFGYDNDLKVWFDNQPVQLPLYAEFRYHMGSTLVPIQSKTINLMARNGSKSGLELDFERLRFQEITIN